MKKFQYSIVTMARWETECILEWLAYHQSICFEHVYLYCNDDDPAELFDRLSPYLAGHTPFVTFLHYPFQGLQWDIYLHWFRNFACEVEWAAFLDVDEFLTMPGINDIRRFASAFPARCDAVHFHWIYYGTSGFVERPAGSVLRQYTRREAKVSHETKNMVRAERIHPDLLRPNQTPFWHMWDQSHKHQLRSYTGLGEEVPVPFDRRRLAVDRADEIRKTAYIAHFARKSTADFRRRAERGVGGQFSGQRQWADAVANGSADRYIAATNAEEDLYLKSYWERTVGTPKAASLVPGPPGPNLALGQPATQSSTCNWSRQSDPQRDAAGAVSGTITGRAAFCTDKEQSPWWQVDLGKRQRVQEIRVFNRVDDMGIAARANHLILLISDDADKWQEIYHRSLEVPFGWADGNPLIWTAEPPKTLRYLRVMIPALTWLGLDQVEVYGPSE